MSGILNIEERAFLKDANLKSVDEAISCLKGILATTSDKDSFSLSFINNLLSKLKEIGNDQYTNEINSYVTMN